MVLFLPQPTDALDDEGTRIEPPPPQPLVAVSGNRSLLITIDIDAVIDIGTPRSVQAIGAPPFHELRLTTEYDRPCSRQETPIDKHLNMMLQRTKSVILIKTSKESAFRGRIR